MSGRPVMVLLSYFEVAVGALAIAYAILLAYAWFFSDGMIFRPPPATYPDGPEILKLTMPDGVELAARYLPYPASRFTLIYFHGNAEDLGQNEAHLQLLRSQLQVSVLAWDYRGYGRSGGHPDEPDTLRDAQAVFAYVTDQLKVPAGRIVLYGWSLGGGPAVDLAARHRVGGLILQNAFTSAFRVMTRVRLLPFDKFVTLEKMPRVACPVLVIHGAADQTVPFAHGRQLYAAAPGPKAKLWVDGAGHNDLIETAGEAYWQALRGFLARL